MVTALLSRVARAARDDFRGLTSAIRATRAAARPPSGLLAYDFVGNGGRTRIHLRMQDDGTAMLFVDVTDAVHLSATAAHMAWLVLERRDEHDALAALHATYARVSREALRRDYRQIARVLDTLTTPSTDCRSCLAELPTTPLFSVRARAPHKVDLAITYECSNECPHCYNDPQRFDLGSLATDDWKRVLDRLAAVGVPHVIFTGGEATLHKGLPEIVAHANGLGMIAGLNSNGRTLAHGPILDRLARAGLDHVQITLESHVPEVHDAMVAAPRAFAQTVAGIRASLQAIPHTITNTTITRVNKDHVEETVSFLHGLGTRSFAMNGMIYSGGGDANPDAIPQAMLPPILVGVRERARALSMRFLWYTVTEYCEMSPVELEIGAKRCNAGEYSMCIEPNGDVLPCQSYYVAAGNMLRDPWDTIWKGDLFRSFRDREDDPRAAGLPPKCWECPDLPLCGGGCRIERESKDGNAPGGCQSCASGGAGGGVRSSGKAAQVCGSHASDASLVQLRRKEAPC